MVNNVGTTTTTLPAQLGEALEFNSIDTITIITGVIGKGFLVFDTVGTLGVISSFTDENHFLVTTYALSLDLETILNDSY